MRKKKVVITIDIFRDIHKLQNQTYFVQFQFHIYGL